MEWFQQLAMFVAGIVCLYYGAEWLVGGSTKLAEGMGVRKIVVGLTVVAFGTSAPELIVSGLASFHAKGENALANVVGSNIANIGLILGLACFLKPLTIDRQLLRWEVPLMIFASVLLWGLAEDAVISRVDGVLLLILFLLFIYTCVTHAKDTGSTQMMRRLTTGKKFWYSGMSVAGVAMLWAGGELLLGSAEFFATLAGVPPELIFLTLVAVGTSLPELIVSIMASLKDSSDISVGNVVGSNLFNILLVLGVAAVIRPIPVSPVAQGLHIPMMVAFAIVTFPMMRRRFSLGRPEGYIILAAYLASIVVSYMFMKGGQA